MENIIEPNETFDFSKLTLAHPIGIQGGACFTKIEYNKKPLFIQTPKSLTRQGFVKTGKKYYCDLMFDKNSETLINWFENLEEKCQKLIYEKKDSWFRNAMEETDIESAFNSIIRVYKSGKYYLVRTNIKNSDVNDTNKLAINIYDESHTQLTMEDVKLETYIISIIEIQGIKFTSRNFQIEIELKQAMVLNNNPIFNSCLIKTSNKNEKDVSLEKEKDLSLTTQNKESNTTKLDILDDKIIDDDETDMASDNTINNTINNAKNEIPNENIDLELDIEDLDEKFDNSNENIKEVDIEVNLENNLETFTLKKPNQVYFDLYKEARNKAKLAKKNAIIAYLEAKNIKKIYMIDNLDDSESEFDAEIDEVSESELEGL